MKKLVFIFIFLIFTSILGAGEVDAASWWKIQSVDTMKYSRDLAREKLGDTSFDQTIDFQIKNISELGATHVAVGTPYDSEFLPYLRRWVNAARKYGLKVWFRGNFSGWEGWFGRKAISASEHTQMVEDFILSNEDLFENGDIFSSCPECENGRPGDPRNTGKVSEFRTFIINEYKKTDAAFDAIGKDVGSNYFSMNGDVAELVMDKATTKALGGILVVDHYVSDPIQLVNDIKSYRDRSGGEVMLGEIGAPIPDIHGRMTEKDQAIWLEDTLTLLAKEPGIEGINYWVLTGGSTGIWNENGAKREASSVLESFYKPVTLTVRATDELGRPVSKAKVRVGGREFVTSNDGSVQILKSPGINSIEISANGYKSYTQMISNIEDLDNVTLSSERDNLFLRIIKFIRNIFT